MPRDLFQRPGTTTDAIIDIFVDRLSREELRKRWGEGAYGNPGPRAEHMAAWLKLRDGA